MKNALYFLLNPLFIALVFVLFSCSDDSYLGVQTIDPPSDPDSTKLIGERGGTVTSDDGVIELKISRNALSSPTQISIKKVTQSSPLKDDQGKPIGNVYKLLPSGTKFSIPVKVVMDYSMNASNVEIEKVRIVHWSDSSNYEYLNILDLNNDELSFELDNFSYIQLYDLGTAITLIPDKNFEQALIDLEIDSDSIKNGQVSSLDIIGIKSLYVTDRNIENISGIQGFSELEVLYVSDNKLTKLDISKNLKLIYLECTNNQLTELDVSKQDLIGIHCSSNKLTQLDLSNQTKTEYLSFSKNQISNIDISKLEKLKSLSCDNNLLTNLDISSNLILEAIRIDSNKLTSLDLSENNELLTLSCAYNEITNLSLDEMVNLDLLLCTGNQITSLNLSNNRLLNHVECGGNKIESLDVSNNSRLEMLSLSGNRITNIDVSNLLLLKYFYINDNLFSSIDIKNNEMLEWFNCDRNQISDINISNNTLLKVFGISDNKISTLDLRNNIDLISIWADKNKIKNIDLSVNVNTIEVGLQYNQLESVNVRNGNNSNFTLLDVRDNPLLDCIEVDDVNIPISSSWWKDDNATYSEDCGN